MIHAISDIIETGKRMIEHGSYSPELLAAYAYGVAELDVTTEMRQAVKMLMYGFVYGGGRYTQ